MIDVIFEAVPKPMQYDGILKGFHGIGQSQTGSSGNESLMNPAPTISGVRDWT